MNGLIEKKATMSSVEIARLTGKRNSDVMRDIRTMFEQLGNDSEQFCAEYQDDSGRRVKCYEIPHREVKILITGYDVVRRAKVIDRLEELEKGSLQKPMTSLEILLAQSQALVEQDRRMTALENKLEIVAAQKEQEPNYFSIMAYSRVFGKSLTLTVAKLLGKRATDLSAAWNVSKDEVKDPRFGYVGCYREDVLAEVFNNYFS